MPASGQKPHASAITSRQHAKTSKVVSEAQAILCRRRHQPRRPPLNEIATCPVPFQQPP